MPSLEKASQLVEQAKEQAGAYHSPFLTVQDVLAHNGLDPDDSVKREVAMILKGHTPRSSADEERRGSVGDSVGQDAQGLIDTARRMYGRQKYLNDFPFYLEWPTVMDLATREYDGDALRLAVQTRLRQICRYGDSSQWHDDLCTGDSYMNVQLDVSSRGLFLLEAERLKVSFPDEWLQDESEEMKMRRALALMVYENELLMEEDCSTFEQVIREVAQWTYSKVYGFYKELSQRPDSFSYEVIHVDANRIRSLAGKLRSS